jgi:hypothetical protein
MHSANRSSISSLCLTHQINPSSYLIGALVPVSGAMKYRCCSGSGSTSAVLDGGHHIITCMSRASTAESNSGLKQPTNHTIPRQPINNPCHLFPLLFRCWVRGEVHWRNGNSPRHTVSHMCSMPRMEAIGNVVCRLLLLLLLLLWLKATPTVVPVVWCVAFIPSSHNT